MARPSRWNDVVRSAARVFRQRGFAGASLEEIAENVGMWKGSLYNYISSKEDLLAAVIQIPAERLLADVVVARNGGGTAEDRLRAIIRAHIEVLVDVYDFAAVYLYEAGHTEGHPEWREMDRRYTQMVEDVIVDGMDRGEFRPDQNPRLSAMSVIGALNWLVRWWDPNGSIDPETVIGQISDSFVVGIRDRQQPPARSRPLPTAVPEGGA